MGLSLSLLVSAGCQISEDLRLEIDCSLEQICISLIIGNSVSEQFLPSPSRIILGE